MKYEVKTMKEINHMLNIKVEKVKEEIKISEVQLANIYYLNIVRVVNNRLNFILF